VTEQGQEEETADTEPPSAEETSAVEAAQSVSGQDSESTEETADEQKNE
jgi:hypothetical protein